MSAAYTVKTTAFQGPLDLLLDLVSRRKLFVNDVSLAEVTDDFVRYISGTKEISLSESAEFILVAATLMLIKSRSLLPTLTLTEEEEESIHDLEHRLTIYKRIRELSDLVRPIFGKKVIFEKEPRRNNNLVVFSPDHKVTKETLSSVIRELIELLPKEEILPNVVVKKVVSLEEMIGRLAERISQGGRLYFHDMNHKDKISTIVGFLAMLELVKRGAIRAIQNTKGQIEIEREDLATPHYA